MLVHQRVYRSHGVKLLDVPSPISNIIWYLCRVVPPSCVCRFINPVVTVDVIWCHYDKHKWNWTYKLTSLTMGHHLVGHPEKKNEKLHKKKSALLKPKAPRVRVPWSHGVPTWEISSFWCPVAILWPSSRHVVNPGNHTQVICIGIIRDGWSIPKW